jgi:hypothetical protein
MKQIFIIMTMTLGLSIGFSADAEAQKKWSRKAKGAVIGGVVGAATGVAVSKNDSKGAIIGGAVGAGAGYIYGRSRDRKAARQAMVTQNASGSYSAKSNPVPVYYYGPMYGRVPVGSKGVQSYEDYYWERKSW